MTLARVVDRWTDTGAAWKHPRGNGMSRRQRCARTPFWRYELTDQLSSVQAELHLARDQLLDSRAAHERDVEELQLYQQRDRNSAMPEESGDARKPRGNLGGELESIGSPGETKTE